MAKATELDLGAWFILRMANVDTVKVYRALLAYGIEAWTPIERKVRRTPRKRLPYDSEAALLPSYVFASAAQLDEVLKLSRRPNREIPQFSVLHHLNGVPLIDDCQLDALRGEEGRLGKIFERLKRMGRKGPKLLPGDSVKMHEGPMMGLSGVVEGQQGQYTLISFDGFPSSIKISSILLLPDEAKEIAQAA